MSTALALSPQAIKHFSHKDLVEAAKKTGVLAKRLDRFKEKASEATEKVVRTVEVGSASLLAGVIQGRYGAIEVAGVPAELGAGILLNLAGYFGLAGKHSDHLCNFGDGALAAYLVTVGKGVGATMAQKAGGAPATKTSGSALTPDEIAAAVAAAR